MAHELAHSMLHQGGESPESKTLRETEAEAVAYVVCQAIGLDANSSASDYIQMYDGKRDTLVGSLERIQRTASEIIGGLQGQEEGQGRVPAQSKEPVEAAAA